MLLKKIVLDNFRQFIGEQSVEFATNSKENVTIMMGENGSGKTSFSQAFIWCLYGVTDFVDKNMLNKQIAAKLMPTESITVRVDLYLTHKSTNYILTRKQKYRKDSIGKISSGETVFFVAYTKNGQQEFLQYPETISVRDEILPKELSQYFFFDGERIGNMSKEIQKGRSKTFGNAVRGLLGLNAFEVSIDHLKPTSKYSVIGSYNESFNDTSDQELANINKQIDVKQDLLDKIEIRLNEIEDEFEQADEKCNELQEYIRLNKESGEMEKERERLRKRIQKQENIIINTKKSISRAFNRNAHQFFLQPLINDAKTILSDEDFTDKGIDDIRDTTIQFLIERGKCLCGTKIEFGNDAYKTLHELLKYVPPQSIGAYIRQFLESSDLREENLNLIYQDLSEPIGLLLDQEGDLQTSIDNLKIIDDKLDGVGSISVKINDLRKYEKVLKRLQEEKETLIQKKGRYLSEQETFIADRSKLALRDDKNRKIEVYKAYAQYMYDYLRLEYKKNEDEIRNLLEKYINEIFSSIYEGGLSLKIDDKYSIEVLVDDYNEFNTGVETSTAQSISVIFAFISGIIKIARESKQNNDDHQLIDAEPYPLVMDAPLSAFDRRRIETVCDALPKVAEQVIIFIKDTDGELADENMSDKIGKRYLFDKVSEFETTLVKG